MVEKKIDARGLSCPEPVLMVKKALQAIDSGTVEVLVDTTTSCENVTRIAETLGCTVETAEAGDGSSILLIRKAEA